MIHDPLLRWVVTGLFAFSAIECGLPILTRHRPWTVVISHSLHFLMAVAMAVMAWPWSTRLPTTGPAVFFLLAAAWFTTLGIIATSSLASRVTYGYHSLMMLATAWMYASMDGPLLPTPSPSQPSISMPGMDMVAMNEPASSGAPTWFSAANWLGTVIFTAATLFWTLRYLTESKHSTARFKSLGKLGQATMAAGMAILFLATLSRI